MGQQNKVIKQAIGLLAFLSTLCFAQVSPADVAGGLQLHGFAGVGYSTAGASTPDDQRIQGFYFENLDLMATPDLGHNLKTYLELLLQPDQVNGAVITNIETAHFGYTLNDNNTIWAGLFNAPLGSWNTQYSHGKQSLIVLARPRFLEYEELGGMLPVRSTGVWWQGSLDHGGDKFKYDVFVANGDRIIPNASGSGGQLDPNLLKTDHPNAEIGLNLGYQFRSGKVDGLLIGLHAFQTQTNAYGSATYTPEFTAPTAQVGQQMYGVYANYMRDKLNTSFEFYLLNDSNKAPGASDTHQANFFFVEGDYQIRDQWRPFVMFEKTSMDSADTYFTALLDSSAYTRTTIGARYDISSDACLKAAWAGTNQQSTPGLTALATGSGTTYYDKWSVQYALKF